MVAGSRIGRYVKKTSVLLGHQWVFLVFWIKNAGLSWGLFSSVLAGITEFQAFLVPMPEYRGGKEKVQGTRW